MKKLIYVFSAVLLFALSSCSSDEKTAPTSEKVVKTTNSETSKLGLGLNLPKVPKIGVDGVVELTLVDAMHDGTLVVAGINEGGDVFFYPTPEQLSAILKYAAQVGLEGGEGTCGCSHDRERIKAHCGSCCFVAPSAQNPTCVSAQSTGYSCINGHCP